MEKSGKWLVIAIIAIALGLGAFSWWFRWSATHRAAEFWGQQAATTIRDAKQVEAYRLAVSPSDNDQTLAVGGREFPIEERIDASQGHGLVHLKQALLEDRSYDWSTPARNAKFAPRWALVFHPLPTQVSAKPVSLLFDDACTQGVGVVEGSLPQPVPCAPIAEGLTKVFADWFPADSN